MDLDSNRGLTLDIGILFERSSFTNEAGAAIHVGPNAAPVLKALGFDVERAQLMEVLEGRIYDAKTMEESYRGSYEDFAEKFGARWYFSHRVDLHDELKRLALGSEGKFRGANLRLATTVVAVDCENGIMKLEDGTTVRKDVIVGADGVHSIIAKGVLDSGVPSVEIGECAYRFLIPTEILRQNHITAQLFQDSRTRFSLAALTDRRLVWYPCRNGELQNFVGIHSAKADRVETESWNASGSTQDLLNTFSEFHPALLEMCRLAEDPKLWKLVYRPPIKQWTKGKVILIGDAAHPMLPHQGQGGNQGIEDAGALGVFLANIPRLEDVPSRLELVQNTRRNSAAAIQIFSNAGQDQAARIEEKARQYVQGPIPKNPAEFNQWNFGYNVVSECEQVLSEITGKATP